MITYGSVCSGIEAASKSRPGLSSGGGLMRYLSMFSGIEGASQAWVPLGWTPVGVCEIEAFPRAVLAHHYPEVPNLGDVSKITEGDIRRLGRVDLIVGGFPCQDVSIAGKRKGLKNDDDTLTRSGLFFEAMRLVRIAREHCGLRWLVIENVPGLYSSNQGRDFAAVVSEVVGCGFDVPRGGWENSGCAAGPDGFVEWATLDAQFWGLAQRRKRVFFVVDFGDWASRSPVLLERDSLQGDPAPRRQAQQRATPAAGAGAAAGGGEPELFKALMTPSGGIDREDRHTLIVGDDAAPALTAAGGTERKHGQGWGQREYEQPGFLQVAYGGNRTGGPIDVATAMRAKGGTGHGDFESETFIAHSLTADGFDASEDGSGRGTPLIAWPLVADPVTAVEGKTYTHEGKNNFRLHNVVEHPVFTLAARGRDGSPQLEFRDDELANAILTPSGGRAGIGVGAVAIGITLHGSDGTRSTATETETASSLRARPPGGIDNCTTTAVLAFTAKDHGADADEEVAPTLRAGGHDKSHANAGVMPAVATSQTGEGAGLLRKEVGVSAVRRLTPRIRECCRLQGYPDDYLDIEFRGKPAADGPKYKALGNAFATPVVRYIGERIAACCGNARLAEPTAER
jgi:DNA (cytosine-5)-methyltransferase 1